MSDLPYGYRWAMEDEMDRPDAILVPLTVSSNGHVYTQDEADVAVPWDCMVEFDMDHPHDPEACERLIAGMNAGYDDGYDSYDDIEYNSYMYGSERL